jgi:thioredoxin 1
MPTGIDNALRVSSGGATPANVGKVTLLNGTNFDSVIASTPGPVAVEFMNFACHHCIRAQPMLEDVARALGNRMTVFQVESHQSPELFRRFGIRGTPEFLMFEGGVEKARGHLSAITPFEIRKVITAPFQG